MAGWSAPAPAVVAGREGLAAGDDQGAERMSPTATTATIAPTHRSGTHAGSAAGFGGGAGGERTGRSTSNVDGSVTDASTSSAGPSTIGRVPVGTEKDGAGPGLGRLRRPPPTTTGVGAADQRPEIPRRVAAEVPAGRRVGRRRQPRSGDRGGQLGGDGPRRRAGRWGRRRWPPTRAGGGPGHRARWPSGGGGDPGRPRRRTDPVLAHRRVGPVRPTRTRRARAVRRARSGRGRP